MAGNDITAKPYQEAESRLCAMCGRNAGEWSLSGAPGLEGKVLCDICFQRASRTGELRSGMIVSDADFTRSRGLENPSTLFKGRSIYSQLKATLIFKR